MGLIFRIFAPEHLSIYCYKRYLSVNQSVRQTFCHYPRHTLLTFRLGDGWQTISGSRAGLERVSPNDRLINCFDAAALIKKTEHIFSTLQGGY